MADIDQDLEARIEGFLQDLERCDPADPDDLRAGDLPPEFSEDDLARRFTEQHGADWRYVAVKNSWMRWDGQTWAKDETHRVWDAIRAICRTASALVHDPKVQRAICSAKTIAAVERIAKSDRVHAATLDMWDSDPWLLNTPGGVVDLRTGAISPHDRSLYMTKITAVSPERGTAPIWSKFLSRVLHDDADLIGFVQRIFGYGLTGHTREHALFFFYGMGRNGKGTAVNTIASIMGPYAATAQASIFMQSQFERHSTDMAMLQGARMVNASELDEGQAWAEAKIKSLTGGDPITARFMRQDNFTFLPQFSLIISGNHKPKIKNLDEAMRARLNLIPFTVQIPATERDPALPEKMKAEWPQILQWVIDGAVAWARNGLQRPQSVIDATAEYFVEQDKLGDWISENCNVGDGLKYKSSDLFKDWLTYAREHNEKDLNSQNAFNLELEKKGYVFKRSNGSWFHGIGLKPRHDGRLPDDDRGEDTWGL